MFKLEWPASAAAADVPAVSHAGAVVMPEGMGMASFD